MKPTKLGALACALVVAAGLAACGSSSKKSSSTTGSTAAAVGTPASAAGAPTSADAPNGTPFVIGTICGCSGPQASVLGGSEKVVVAWADSVNASGGINGHPVKLIVKDDGENPSTSMQDAKQLIEQDHVLAIVGDSTTADTAFASYVAAKGVPVVGGIAVEPTLLSNPDFFPSGGNLISLLTGMIEQAKAAGKKNLGVMYCAESPICAQLVPLAQGIGKVVGIKITGQAISATAPSYTAPCLTFKAAGVDALNVADNGPVVARVIAACAQQGYKPLNVGESTSMTPDLLKNAAFQSALMSGSTANPYDTSLPVTKRMQDALDKYDPGFTSSSEFTDDMAFPWSGGVLFEDAAKAGHLSPGSSPADVAKALYSLNNETVQGLSGPMTFTAGKPTLTTCWFAQEVECGKLVSKNGNKPSCLTPTQSAALATALKLG
jgi:branched-chain amino acid transport system substrate-binding protein